MAIQTSRLNITAATFPLISTNFGRSGITRMRDDTNYVITNQYSGAQADRDIGIPMCIYMHNVIPTTQGLKSVAFKEVIRPQSNEDEFDKIILLRSQDELKNFFVPAAGKNFILAATNPESWTSYKFPTLYNGNVTHAYINGKTYICYERYGVFEYDALLNSFQAVNFNGIVTNGIGGITSANNYLVMWDSDTVYWSSAIDQLDFTPSLSTTAGSGKVQSARGAIVCCLPIHDGFVVYTTANAVVGTFTGNIRFPWSFREIPGSAGISTSEHVTYDANYDTHFAWTTSGMQEISKQKAIVIWPEVSDFLTERYFEDYTGADNNNINTDVAEAFSSRTQLWQKEVWNLKTFQQRLLKNDMRVKLNFLGSRYVVVSYGPEKFLTHMLIYDIALQRWGKLRIKHSDVFQWVKPNYKYNSIEPRKNFGILKPDGSIVIADFDEASEAKDSVILYGRLMGLRGRSMQLNAIEFENVQQSKKFNCKVLTSFDGKNYERLEQPLETIASDDLRRFQLRATGINHCILMEGTFNLNTLQIEFTLRGKP